MRRWLALTLLAAAPGCSLIDEPGPREVTGPTDGYLATTPFLKVYVRSEETGNLLLVDFDRKDWAVSRIAERLDRADVEYLSVRAVPRSLIGEYLVDAVLSPSDLEAYRYEAMGASAEERSLLDAEYDALLARLAEAPGASAPVAEPELLAPPMA